MEYMDAKMIASAYLVRCSICHRIFQTASNDWFRHWNDGLCHGKEFTPEVIPILQ